MHHLPYRVDHVVVLLLPYVDSRSLDSRPVSSQKQQAHWQDVMPKVWTPNQLHDLCCSSNPLQTLELS